MRVIRFKEGEQQIHQLEIWQEKTSKGNEGDKQNLIEP